MNVKFYVGYSSQRKTSPVEVIAVRTPSISDGLYSAVRAPGANGQMSFDRMFVVVRGGRSIHRWVPTSDSTDNLGAAFRISYNTLHRYYTPVPAGHIKQYMPEFYLNSVALLCEEPRTVVFN